MDVYEIAEEIFSLLPTGTVVETYYYIDFTMIIFTYKSDRAKIYIVDNTMMVTIYTSTTDKLGWQVWKEEHCSYDIDLDLCRTLMLVWCSTLSEDNV